MPTSPLSTMSHSRVPQSILFIRSTTTLTYQNDHTSNNSSLPQQTILILTIIIMIEVTMSLAIIEWGRVRKRKRMVDMHLKEMWSSSPKIRVRWFWQWSSWFRRCHPGGMIPTGIQTWQLTPRWTICSSDHRNKRQSIKTQFQTARFIQLSRSEESGEGKGEGLVPFWTCCGVGRGVIFLGAPRWLLRKIRCTVKEVAWERPCRRWSPTIRRHKCHGSGRSLSRSADGSKVLNVSQRSRLSVVIIIIHANSNYPPG